MGERNKRTDAIILTLKRLGENNSSVSFLSAERGILYSVLYGGPKSKMRSLVQPFNSGILYTYEDKAKSQSKIMDFEVKNYHQGVKANLYKIWAANLASELVFKTKCGGEPKTAFLLLSAFLDGCDITDENNARLGTIRFLWRYLALLGVRPEPEKCGKTFSLGNEAVGYLQALNTLSPAEVRALRLSAETVYQLKAAVFSLISEAVGDRLNTIETGYAIL